jgi:hypothetical protein
MGKDREGKFHPKKGRPSGEGNTKGFDSHADAGAIEQQIKLEDTLPLKETGAPETMRHPNRKTDKTRRRSAPLNSRKRPSRTTATVSADSIQHPVEDPIIDEGITYGMSRTEFQDLDKQKGNHFFSFYLTTHQSGVEVNEQHDRIAFKTAVQKLATQLEQAGETGPREVLLTMTEPLLSKDPFWRRQSKGLAVLITDGFIRVIKLPYAPGNFAESNKKFFLRPLLPLIMNDEYYYVLLLSKKQAKVFRADRFSIAPVSIPELPDGIEDVVHFEEKNNEGLFRTGSSGGGGGANYHGLGESGPDHKENIAMYAKEVDRTLHQFLLGKESVPLVLAGVGYLLNIFRKTSTYGHIWEEQVEGNVEYTDLATLHQDVHKLMEPYFESRLRRAIDAYGVKSDTSRVSSQPAEIIPAAHYSRISHLFVQEGHEMWGTFNELSNSIVMHNMREEGDESLVDRAVVKTIVNGGDVHILPERQMPNSGGLAAVMRFDA